MGNVLSKVLQSSALVWYGHAVLLKTDSAEGSADDSDLEKRMAELDFDIAQESNISADKDDDEKTIHHSYFQEDVSNNEIDEGSSSANIPESDNISESTCPPICPPLPSGHTVQVSMQQEDGTESIFTRRSKYDKKQANFSERHFLGDGVNQLLTACRSGDVGVVKRLRENENISIDMNNVYGDFGDGRQDSDDDDEWNDDTDTDTKKRFGFYVPGGFTPLILACCHGHLAVIREIFLYDGIKVNQQNNAGRTALYQACSKGHTGVVRFLFLQQDIDINTTDDRGTTPFLAACLEGRAEIVRMFLARPDVHDLNQVIRGDQTALIHACYAIPFWLASKQCRELDSWTDVVRVLLEQPSVNVNVQDCHGQTALMLACMFGHTDIVRLFLAHPDTDVTIMDRQGNTALMYASEEFADTTRLDEDMINLLKKGLAEVISILIDHLARNPAKGMIEIDAEKEKQLSSMNIPDDASDDRFNRDGFYEDENGLAAALALSLQEVNDGGTVPIETQNFNNTFGQTYDEDAALAKALLESMEDVQNSTNQRPVDLERLRAQLRQARFEGDHMEENRILYEIAQAEQKSEGANQQNDTSTEIGTDSIEIGDQGSVMDLNNASQILRDPEGNDIKLVMAQGSCSRSQAIEALKANNNDIVEAIMSLTNDGNDLVSMINGEADNLQTDGSEQKCDNPFTKLIESNDKNLVKIAFDTMDKIVTKIVQNPNELKYKRINRENKVICKKILDLSGGWEAIVGIGFQRDGKMLMNTISISSLSSIQDDIRRYSALAESAIDGPDLVEKFRASVATDHMNLQQDLDSPRTPVSESELWEVLPQDLGKSLHCVKCELGPEILKTVEDGSESQETTSTYIFTLRQPERQGGFQLTKEMLTELQPSGVTVSQDGEITESIVKEKCPVKFHGKEKFRIISITSISACQTLKDLDFKAYGLTLQKEEFDLHELLASKNLLDGDLIFKWVRAPKEQKTIPFRYSELRAVHDALEANPDFQYEITIGGKANQFPCKLQDKLTIQSKETVLGKRSDQLKSWMEEISNIVSLTPDHFRREERPDQEQFPIEPAFQVFIQNREDCEYYTNVSKTETEKFKAQETNLLKWILDSPRKSEEQRRLSMLNQDLMKRDGFQPNPLFAPKPMNSPHGLATIQEMSTPPISPNASSATPRVSSSFSPRRLAANLLTKKKGNTTKDLPVSPKEAHSESPVDDSTRDSFSEDQRNSASFARVSMNSLASEFLEEDIAFASSRNSTGEESSRLSTSSDLSNNSSEEKVQSPKRVSHGCVRQITALAEATGDSGNFSDDESEVGTPGPRRESQNLGDVQLDLTTSEEDRNSRNLDELE